ncbi:MAG: hypothetical protein V3T17_16150 [Pseudomonadales bacterium]
MSSIPGHNPQQQFRNPTAHHHFENKLEDTKGETLNLDAMFSNMKNDLSTDSKNLSELDHVLAAQADTMDRIRRMRETIESKDNTTNLQLQRELEIVQQRVQSASVIALSKYK